MRFLVRNILKDAIKMDEIKCLKCKKRITKRRELYIAPKLKGWYALWHCKTFHAKCYSKYLKEDVSWNKKVREFYIKFNLLKVNSWQYYVWNLIFFPALVVLIVGWLIFLKYRTMNPITFIKAMILGSLIWGMTHIFLPTIQMLNFFKKFHKK